MARNYAALPHEYLEEMSSLSDAEFGRLCRALLEYSANGTPMALSGNERFFAARVKMQEDRYQQSYDALMAKRREAGAKGAAARWDGKAKQTMANDGIAIDRIAPHSKNGKTETETKTEIKTNNIPSIDGSITRVTRGKKKAAGKEWMREYE